MTVSHAKLFRYHANVAKREREREKEAELIDVSVGLLFENRHHFLYSTKVLDKVIITSVWVRVFGREPLRLVTVYAIFSQSSNVMQPDKGVVCSFTCMSTCQCLAN